MPSWEREPGRISGSWTVYRQVAPGYPPLWYGAGDRSARQDSARWHRAGEDVAQYFCLSSDGAWAERVRYESVRDDERRLADRRNLWQLLVEEAEIADLRSFDAYVEAGLRPEVAIGPHAGSQRLADDLRAAGYRGILSPAAALDVDGALNLTLFGERLELWLQGRPLAPDPANPDPGLWVPAVQLVDRGSPTEYAMRHTCYRTADHRTLRGWRSATA